MTGSRQVSGLHRFPSPITLRYNWSKRVKFFECKELLHAKLSVGAPLPMALEGTVHSLGNFPRIEDL